MVQVLHISNGDTINKKLQAKNGRVEKLWKSGMSNQQLIEEIYMTSLSRFPTDDERSRLIEILKDASDVDRRILIEDVFWAVLSSREFLFNH